MTTDAPRRFTFFADYFAGRDGTSEGQHIEGIVWHHPDGRMVKIKAKDFGFKRQSREEGTDHA